MANVVSAPQVGPVSAVWSIHVSFIPNTGHPVGQLCFASNHLCNQQLAWRPIENQVLSPLCLSLTHLQQQQSKSGVMARSEWLLKTHPGDNLGKTHSSSQVKLKKCYQKRWNMMKKKHIYDAIKQSLQGSFSRCILHGVDCAAIQRASLALWIILAILALWIKSIFREYVCVCVCTRVSC